MTDDHDRSIAVLGTGIMGAPMARNLAKAGFDVRVWNRTRAKAEPLAGDGATVCDTALEAMQGADLVLTMLADAAAVEQTVSEDDALRTAAHGRDVVWIQSATVGVRATEQFAALAERAGVTFVDAPVLGTKAPAEAGKLTVLASGPETVRSRVQPVFDVVGQKTIWLGDAGQGSRLKLVMNSWVLALNTATAEALGLAAGLGLDPTAFLSTIEGGGLDVQYAHLKGGMMLKGDYPPSFPLWGALKDAGLILDAAAQAGVPMHLAEGARTQLQAAADAGHADEDMAAVFRAVQPGG
jgi:3-hydroxyisobutyrate dehydrogenase